MSDVMEKMKTFVCGDARIEAISKDGGMQISLDGAPLDLACLCATTIRRIAEAMRKPHFEVLLKVLMFLQADEVTFNVTETSIDVQRIQQAMGGSNAER